MVDIWPGLPRLYMRCSDLLDALDELRVADMAECLRPALEFRKQLERFMQVAMIEQPLQPIVEAAYRRGEDGRWTAVHVDLPLELDQRLRAWLAAREEIRGPALFWFERSEPRPKLVDAYVEGCPLSLGALAIVAQQLGVDFPSVLFVGTYDPRVTRKLVGTHGGLVVQPQWGAP